MNMRRTLLLAFLLAAGWCSGQRLVPYEVVVDSWGVEDLLVHDGKLLIAGGFPLINGVHGYALVSLDTLGIISQIGPFTAYESVDHLVSYGDSVLMIYDRVGMDYGVAMWDGNTWEPVGGTFNTAPRALTLFNGQPVAVGSFTQIGGVNVPNVVRWDGTSWMPLGPDLNGTVMAAEVHQGELYIAGGFTSSNGIPLAHVAKLTGQSWAPVGQGLNDNVVDIRSHSSELLLIGSFTHTSDSSVVLPNSARWTGSQYLPLSATPLASWPKLVYSPELGLMISDEDKTILNPGPDEQLLGMYHIKAVESFEGHLLAGGLFEYPSFDLVRWLGELIPGDESTTLDAAGMRVGVNMWSGLGYHPVNGLNQFEVPKGSGNHVLRDHSLCAVGVSNGNVYAVPDLFFTQSRGYHGWDPGPWGADTSEAYWRRYYQVWKMDNGLVWDHAAHWADPGYVPDRRITTWPGNGDQLNNEAPRLAPFADNDLDGNYEPVSGELPMFRGDASIYTVRSDKRAPLWSGGPPMGLELHTMDHQYGVPASDLRHHVHFQHYWAINRSQVTYDTLWLMSFTWHAIGVDFEDYVGCDTTLNMGFAYNADAFDQWPSGYGEHPPALGILALNAPLAAFRPYTAGGVSGKPSTPEQYLFAAKGQLLNGSTVVDPITNQESLHWYAGDPADPSQWSEVSEMNYPEDRRTISTYGPWYNVAPGDTVCLDLAFVFAQDTLGDNLSSVTLLKQRAAAVKAWYDQQTLGCGEYIALDVAEPGVTTSPGPLLFPNPTSDRLAVRRIPDGVEELLVLDLLGRPVSRLRVVPGAEHMQLDLSTLAPGSYLVSFTGSVKVPAQRVLVVR